MFTKLKKQNNTTKDKVSNYVLTDYKKTKILVCLITNCNYQLPIAFV